jgi:hypothetical protein
LTTSRRQGILPKDTLTRSPHVSDHTAELELIALEIQELTTKLYDRVEIARSQGDTWAEIGAALGVTRQAAAERFGSVEPGAQRRRDITRRNTAQEHTTIELDEPEPVRERKTPRAQATRVDAPRGSIDAYQTTVADQIASASSYFQPKAR